VNSLILKMNLRKLVCSEDIDTLLELIVAPREIHESERWLSTSPFASIRKMTDVKRETQ
jgi:hypothetical protein